MISRVLAVAAALMAASPVMAQQHPHPAGMPGMAGASTAADDAMMEGMKAMNQAMGSTPMTGDPDHDFVAMMIPHHQGAIEMAKVELQYGKDPAIRKLARAVIAAQQGEIAEMKRWQAGHRNQ